MYPTVEISYNQVLCINNLFPQQDDPSYIEAYSYTYHCAVWGLLCDVLKAPTQCGISPVIVRGCFRTEYGICCIVVRRFLFCYANSAILNGYIYAKTHLICCSAYTTTLTRTRYRLAGDWPGTAGIAKTPSISGIYGYPLQH